MNASDGLLVAAADVVRKWRGCSLVVQSARRGGGSCASGSGQVAVRAGGGGAGNNCWLEDCEEAKLHW